jgi:tetratricopeptide (TPR) repeat protein
LSQVIIILSFDVNHLVFDSADGYKDKGNEFYKNNNYDSAIKMYTKAIDMDATPTYFTNRAAAYLQMKNYRLALRDCVSATEKDEKNVKAHFRASQAHLGLGDVAEAKRELDRALELAPNDNQIRNEVRFCFTLLTS